MDKTLARLPSFIHDSSPESCPLLRSLSGTILHLCSCCRLCLSHIVRLSVSIPRLLRLRVPVRQAAGGGDFCAASGSPFGVPVLYNFRCSLSVSLFVRLYRVLLSMLYFLWLLAAVLLRRSGGFRVSVLGTTIASPMISE